MAIMMRNNEREVEGARTALDFSVCPDGSGMCFRHPNGQTGILYREGYLERKPYSFAL